MNIDANQHRIGYKIFNRAGEQIGEILAGTPRNFLEDCKRADATGGWLESMTGDILYGRKPSGTISIKMTWKGCLPILLEAYANGTDKGRAMALEELQRMAEAADAYNAGSN